MAFCYIKVSFSFLAVLTHSVQSRICHMTQLPGAHKDKMTFKAELVWSISSVFCVSGMLSRWSLSEMEVVTSIQYVNKRVKVHGTQL